MHIVFDLNGTLLDTGALEPLFARLFGDGKTAKQWFTRLTQYSMAVTLAGRYFEFSEIAEAVFGMFAESRGARIGETERRELSHAMRQMPPFPDTIPALTRLREAGFRMAVLTNSSERSLRQQVANAGLEPFFEALISVDGVRKFKPAPEVYRFGAERLGVAASQIRMVAAHAWDVMGAIAAGCEGALVQREEHAPFPLSGVPGIVGTDLIEVAERIIAAHKH